MTRPETNQPTPDPQHDPNAPTAKNPEWPAIPVAEWADTRDTFQLMTQIVGKILMTETPMQCQWWNVTLLITSRGLTTGLIPHPKRSFQIDFDLIDQLLVITTTDGAREELELRARPVAEFYRDVMAMLADLGLATSIWTMPVEIPDAIPFDEDTTHVAYDGAAVHRFWLAMVQINRVFDIFRARFVGKVSPTHFFWGALDLAVTRFSGRDAPKHPGGAPNCGPHVMWEAYSQEVSSAGYWPGPGGEGNFYSYAYPEPEGFRSAQVAPDAAYFDEDLGEFLLPYEAVRLADDPDAMLLEFLDSTYVAAADLADWDRQALER